MQIKKSKLFNLINEELKNSVHLTKFKNINKLLLNQAVKESSLNVFAERYEAHLDDKSVGIFQLLTSTINWLGYEFEDETDYFKPENQVKFAIKYLDWLYSKFPEIRNPHERLKFAVASYNMGKGNINKGLKKCRELENIYYNGKNTLQGKWCVYDNVIKIIRKYGIVKETNADINENYVNFIFMD